MRTAHKRRGWSDVGYHYFITKAGEIQEGRPVRRVPAAQRGHNPGSIAICCHGLKIEKFTNKQYNAVYYLCRAIKDAYATEKSAAIRFRVAASTPHAKSGSPANGRLQLGRWFFRGLSLVTHSELVRLI